MTDKILRTYVGEAQSPIQDLTDYVDWPDSRFIGQAYNGESSVSSIVFRDENGQFGPSIQEPIIIAARNEVEVKHGSNFLFRGRFIGRTWERGVQKAFKAREVVAEAEDVNVELRGLIVDQWVRPAETDRARVLALREDYLDGGVRVGANLSTNLVSSSNTQTLPAKTYTQTDPLGVMQDVAFQTHKQFFVTIDKELFYDGWDSTAYACPFRITDDEADLRANPTTTLSIIPDSGPMFAINGQRFISYVRVYYGSGPDDHVDGSNPTFERWKAYWAETVYAPDGVTTATEANDYAGTLIAERSQDGRTYTLSVGHANGGPLTEAQIGSIKPGMLIRIKSRIIPEPAAYAYYTTRIVSLQWHMPLPNQYFATLKLERPEKQYGIGTKPGPRPAGSSDATVIAGGFIAGGTAEESLQTGGVEYHIPAGLSDSMLVVCGFWQANRLPYGNATFEQDGVDLPMTAISGSDIGHASGGLHPGMTWFYLLNPPPWNSAGDGTIQVLNNVAGGTWKGWALLENVDQSNPFGGVATAQGSSSTASVTASGTGLILNAAASSGDDVPTPPDPVAVAGQIELWSDSLGIGALDPQFGGGYGDSTPSWTLGSSRSWVAGAITVNGTGSSTQPTGDSGDVGTDTGQFANPDHVHGHGTHTADYHTNYVQESTLTTAGDVPYATGASTWTRLPIGSSNFHMRSDGTKPVWSPESAGGGVTDHGALTGLADDDHTQYVLDSTLTTAGDVPYATGASTWTRRAIGGSNTIFKSTSVEPVWSDTARLSYLDVDEHTPPNPPSPPASVIRIYGSNSKGYYKNSGGTVVELGGAGGGGGTTLTIEEVDGTPTVSATKLVLPNGTLSVVGTVATYTPAASGGGDVVYTAAGADTAVNSTTDLTIATRDVTGIVAGDQLIADAWLTILNNSGSGRTFTLTLDFDSLFDVELSTHSLLANATNELVVRVQGILDVRSTSLAYGMMTLEESNASQVSGGDQGPTTAHMHGKGWATTSSDATGTVTVDFRCRSSTVDATQTLRLHHFTIRKVTPT